MTERTLNWRPNPDPLSDLYVVRRRAASARTSRYWWTAGILDQGVEGACVGHGVIGAVTASPIRVRLPYPQQTAFGAYYGSRRIDEWPGESYEGTSVNAGMKLARELGFISAWEWVPTPEALRYTVLEDGPVVVGIWIEEGFEYPDPQGLVEVNGSVIGGHCMYITGFSVNRRFDRYTGPVYQIANSWGADWGRKGFLYMRAHELEAKFGQEGEFAIPRR